MSDENSSESYEAPSRWSRLIPMIILIACFALSESVLYIVAIIQFIWTAVDGEPNEQLAGFGKSLSAWMKQNAAYLTYASNEKPFPWASWPSE